MEAWYRRGAPRGSGVTQEVGNEGTQYRFKSDLSLLLPHRLNPAPQNCATMIQSRTYDKERGGSQRGFDKG